MIPKKFEEMTEFERKDKLMFFLNRTEKMVCAVSIFLLLLPIALTLITGKVRYLFLLILVPLPVWYYWRY